MARELFHNLLHHALLFMLLFPVLTPDCSRRPTASGGCWRRGAVRVLIIDVLLIVSVLVPPAR